MLFILEKKISSELYLLNNKATNMMSPKPPKYSYILAVICGFIPFFIPDIEPFVVLTVSLFFLFSGSLFGFIWPQESWRWGLWIAGPIVAFLGLSVLFGGNLEVFLEKDLPLLLSALTAACAGSFISSWFKKRQKASS